MNSRGSLSKIDEIDGADRANRTLDVFRSMLRIRMVEETIRDLYAEQEIRCPTHLSIGQEAVAAGVCSVLLPQDRVTSAHRSHAHYLARGGSLPRMMAELYGKATGCASGKGGSMHLIDLSVGFIGAVPIVGSTIPIGVGSALSAVLFEEDGVTVIFFGDAAVETGVFHESLNFAALHQLPVVMVCENNLYSVLSPLEVRQPATRGIVDLARGHGVLTFAGDGNDVDEVATISQEAVTHARAGLGPAFIEFETYRWLEHCGPLDDDHLGYRPVGELEAWKRRDPVALHEERLISQGLLSASQAATYRDEIAAEIGEAVAFAKEGPFPSASDLTSHLYSP